MSWGRLSPHPAFERERGGPRAAAASGPRASRRSRSSCARTPTGCSRRPQPSPKDSLSHPAREVLEVLETRGASFFADLTRATGRLASEVEDALWELVAAGLVTADGFENLRALLDPKRRRGEGKGRTARPRHAPGRWALLRHTGAAPEGHAETFARQLLQRWGVVFRDAAVREPLAPPWRDLLVALRRMESRGEIRGGRFLAGVHRRAVRAAGSAGPAARHPPLGRNRHRIRGFHCARIARPSGSFPSAIIPSQNGARERTLRSLAKAVRVATMAPDHRQASTLTRSAVSATGTSLPAPLQHANRTPARRVFADPSSPRSGGPGVG